jgi:hypothetical protein
MIFNESKRRSDVTYQVRTVTVMPTDKWGPPGRGLLGASIGHGYLHALPQKCCSTNGAFACCGRGE